MLKLQIKMKIISVLCPLFFKIILPLPDKMKQIIKPKTQGCLLKRHTNANFLAVTGNSQPSFPWSVTTTSILNKRPLFASTVIRRSRSLSISESISTLTLTKSLLCVVLMVALNPSAKGASYRSTEGLTKISKRRSIAFLTLWVKLSSLTHWLVQLRSSSVLSHRVNLRFKSRWRLPLKPRCLLNLF